MTSQPLEQSLGAFPLAIPDPRPLAGLFGSSPVPPGFYGENWTDLLFVTTNNRKSIIKAAQVKDLALTILAVDAGGFSPQAASSFKMINAGPVEKALSELAKANPALEGRILIPHILAGNLKWEAGSTIGHWKVMIVPGDEKKLAKFTQQDHDPLQFKENHLPAVIQRMITGLTLFCGQAILLAIPLFIFGWQSLMLGLAALLISTLILCLTWPILPGRGWLKGLCAGTIMAIGLAAILIFMLNASGLPAVGLLLSTSWMGIILSGIKA